MYNWSLDDLYLDFDDNFKKDTELINNTINNITTLAAKLDTKDDLESWLGFMQDLNKTVRSQGAYINFRLSTNANDNDALQNYAVLQNMLTNLSGPNALFNKWLKTKEDELATWLNESDLIKEHEFILNETIMKAQYSLSEEAEDIISKMKINGSSLWNQVQTQLTSTKTIELNGKKETLTSLRNMAYSKDADTRKKAFDKEQEIYLSMDDSVAFALNGIKGEVIQTNKLRGYDSPLDETLINSRLSKETLDALLQAIENNLGEFRRYFKHKAKLLGHEDGLPFHDLFAPFELENQKEYSVEDSKEIILDNFKTFSEDLYLLAKRSYEDKWIDFLPKEGKRGGAYCANLPQIKQSRIFTNYGGALSDIVTLAHELGHAYHGHLLEDNSILNTSYTMPVAETASTFCENIIFNASLETANDEEKIMLIENSLQDLAQITVDILSRYKFETEVFRRRENEFLNTKELQNIMIQAQKDTYGDGLSTYHPFMWLNKGHYYSAGNNFYNFPYAFGGLFALGLYAQYELEGDEFVEKYRNLLRQTASASCEDVALVAGIDTKDVAFWQASIDQIVKRIDQYIELTS